MKNPASLSGINQALQTDYGVDRQKESRNPGIWAYVLRSSLAKFSKTSGIKDAIQTASKSSSPSVVFMALMEK